MIKSLKYALCLLALTACLCTSLDGGGSGTNTGNGVIVGKIVDHSGEPVGGVGISLRPDDFLQAPPGRIVVSPKPLTRETTTSFDGSFTIDSLTAGAYSIEANDNRNNAVLQKCSVIEDGPAIILDDAVLEPYAAITGTVAVAPSGVRQYVQIYGLERCVAADSSGDYTFSNLPAGVYTLRVVCPDTIIASVNIPTQQAISGAITQAPPAGWQFSKKIRLNTTAGGANVAGNVFDFPVLVRLTGTNFDFNQASTDGTDLRFVKSNGSPLAYEIERWDAVGQQAEIWVNVDTIFGNDATQYIEFFWGNSNAAQLSRGEPVFDTADGFVGVWHLAGAGNAEAPDATANHFNGTPTDTAPQRTPGIIGDALQFDGNANGLVMKNTAHSTLNFSIPGAYTFSAWVYVDTVYDADEFIAGKGYSQYALRVKGSQSMPSSLFSLDEYVGAPVNGTVMRLAPVVTQQWKHIVGIRDTAKSYLFIDGTCVDSSGTIFYSNGDVQDSTDFSIGRCAVSYTAPANSNSYLAFKGKIDEVRLSNIACTADWVKLSYMNQKDQDALLQW